MKISTLTPQFVNFIPDRLTDGVIYICERYRTAAHNCCCGCGQEVVTPLTPADWSLRIDNGSVTLHPSIGNWSFPCQSHYWIRRNMVIWSGALSQREIDRVRSRDLANKQAHVAAANRRKEQHERQQAENIESLPTGEGPLQRLWLRAMNWWKSGL